VGHIVGTRDIVSFHGNTVEELESALHDAVEHYLEVGDFYPSGSSEEDLMTMTLEQVMIVVRDLPPELRQEVGDFALFLREKNAQSEPEQPQQKQLSVMYANTAPTFEWMGALKELRSEYTSVELQHKAQEWIEESLLRKGE